MNFELWLSENESLLWKLARTYQIPGMDCEDVMQELRLVCWEALKRWTPGRGAKLSTYACMVAKTRMKELFRSSQEKKRAEDGRVSSIDEEMENGVLIIEVIDSGTISPEDAVLNYEIVEITARVFGNLPDNRRSVVQDYYREKKQAYIAKKAGISQPMVHYIIKDFRKKVAEELIKAGMDPAALR